jgi:hypothetical protein
LLGTNAPIGVLDNEDADLTGRDVCNLRTECFENLQGAEVGSFFYYIYVLPDGHQKNTRKNFSIPLKRLIQMHIG